MLKGRVGAEKHAHADEDLGLVEGHPGVGPIAQGFCDQFGVFRKPEGAFRVLPAAFAVQGGGQIPVIQGHQGLDPCLDQRVAELHIEAEARLVHLSGALRQDPGPAHGEAVALEPQLLHDGHVLPPAVVVITGHVAVLSVGHVAALMDQGVPDALAPAVLVPGSFHLGGGAGRAPEKILCKSHSTLLLF